MNFMKTQFRTFLRDESGVVLAEFLILFPMLVWGLIALFAFWDVFRTINITQKAAYSIADLLSRQVVVKATFVDGLQNVLDFLTPNVPASRMRITSIEWDEPTEKFLLLFSRSPGNQVTALTATTAQDLAPFVPTLADSETVIVVETWVDYVPPFDTGVMNFAMGIGNRTFTQLVVTRPRGRRVCLEGTSGCS